MTLTPGSEHSDLVIELQSLPGVTVSGRVVTSTGAVSEAFGSLRSERDRTALPFMGSNISVRSDGRFRSQLVPAGRYTLSVQTHGSEGEREAGSVEIVVGDSAITDVVVVTRPPTRISGRVVTETSGRRLPHPILLGPSTVRRQSAQPYQGGEGGTVKPDGTFEIKSYFSPVRVIQSGALEGWTIKTVRWKGEDVGTAGLQFTPGEPVTDVEVVLGRLASRLTGTVSGTKKTMIDGEEHEGFVVLFRQQPGETDYEMSDMTGIRNGAYPLQLS